MLKLVLLAEYLTPFVRDYSIQYSSAWASSCLRKTHLIGHVINSVVGEPKDTTPVITMPIIRHDEPG
jgi:hypothetical protein